MKRGSIVRVQGDVVIMTVEDIDGDLVSCCWFDKKAALCRAKFHKDILVVLESLPEPDIDTN